MHGREYSVRSLRHDTPTAGRTISEDYLVVEVRKKDKWLIALPDLFSIAHFVASLAKVVSTGRPAREDIRYLEEDKDTLVLSGVLPQIGRRHDRSCSQNLRIVPASSEKPFRRARLHKHCGESS